MHVIHMVAWRVHLFLLWVLNETLLHNLINHFVFHSSSPSIFLLQNPSHPKRLGPMRIEEISLQRSICTFTQGIITNVFECHDIS